MLLKAAHSISHSSRRLFIAPLSPYPATGPPLLLDICRASRPDVMAKASNHLEVKQASLAHARTEFVRRVTALAMFGKIRACLRRVTKDEESYDEWCSWFENKNSF